MFNCLFLKMAIETNNLEAVNMMFYQSDSKCSQVGAQGVVYLYCKMNTKASRQNSKIFTKRKAKKPCSAQKPAGLKKVRNPPIIFLRTFAPIATAHL